MRIVKNSVFPPAYLGDIRDESNTQRANMYKFLSIRSIQTQAHPPTRRHVCTTLF